MIVLKKLSVRNFLSYGNVPTVFDLSSHVNVLIVGSNGMGKSVMADAICYALYGSPYRKIVLKQLINSINQKNSVVELEFEADGINYKVVRGQKPKIFEIYCEGALVDEEAATRDYQNYLETQVLKIAFKTFCQIVVMGSSNFIPFMSLQAGPRREVIEDVLDISLFSKMNEILKSRIKQTKTEMELIDTKIEFARKEATAQRRVVDVLKESVDSRVEEEQEAIDSLIKTRTEAETKLKKLETMYAKFPAIPDFDPNAIRSSERKLDVCMSELNAIHRRKESISKLDTCPTCLQNVGESHKSHVHESYAEDTRKLSEQCNELTEVIEALKIKQAEYERLMSMKAKLDSEQSRTVDLVDSCNSEIAKHQASIAKAKEKTGDIDAEVAKLNQISAEALEIIRRRNELLVMKELQDASLVLLKDSGIKAAIIKEYVPILNKFINRYLGLFGFDVNFHLDENFNESVRSRGRDEFSYNSFSEGEKRKIDLAILWAFRRVTELKNSTTCNLLLMDEIVDSSLDVTSREVFLDILSTEGGNNFIISHTSPSTDMFDAVLQFAKKGDFSYYEYVQ